MGLFQPLKALDNCTSESQDLVTFKKIKTKHKLRSLETLNHKKLKRGKVLIFFIFLPYSAYT